MNASTDKPLLVVGAGIAGVTAALEAAEAGRDVVLVERDPSIGGRVLRAYHYFPKLCPPACGMEINTQRLDKSRHVTVKTQTRVKAANKQQRGFAVTLETAPQYVNDRCTVCGECSKVCPATVPNPHNLGMDEVPAIRLPHDAAWPKRFTLDREACPEGCEKCVEVCAYDAIDLAAKPTEEEIEVGAMVLATGWRPYPLEKLPEFGGGAIANVVANVQIERLRAPNGPTAGKILRPSDQQPPKKIAFVQCAGSRDVNHLPYCSAVCCLASLKQALYVHEQLPECEVTIYYIDRRAPGRNEDVLTKVAALEGVRLVKGKVGKIEEQEGGSLLLKVEDAETGKLLDAEADMVVLATGMVPNLSDGDLPLELKQDEDGFGLDDLAGSVVVAGVARRPEDVAASVRDATGAAAKAIVAAGRGA